MAIIVLLPALLLLVVAVVLVVVLAVSARPNAELTAATAAARRHAVTGAVLALLAGVCAAVALLAGVRMTGEPGLLILGPAAATLAHTGVLAVTELSWPRPRGAVRRVVLAPRSVGSTSPEWLRWTLHGAAVTTAVAVGVGALAAAEDQRSLRLVASYGDGGMMVNTSSPFPGWVYGLPALLAVLVIAAAAEAALRLVVRRPAVAGADAATDAVLRRASAHRVLRGAVAGALATLGPLVTIAGTAVTSGTSSLAANGHPLSGLHALGVALVALGLLVVVAALVVLCLPAPRVPAPQPPVGAPVAA